MAAYVSEYTIFMQEQLAKHPEWDEDKLVGRALLWDRPINLDEQQELKQARVDNKPYPYDVNFEQD